MNNADTQTIKLDTVIIGGGIAGLWLLNRLSNEGHQVALFEQDALGSCQTIASQGMIHGGIKYALSGALTGSSEAIAAMPERWRQCLRGEGDVDLRHAKTLSEHFYLWSTAGVGSRVTSFFASKATRGRVQSLKKKQLPPPFDHADFRGAVYRLIDLVLDVPSLIDTLYQNYTDRIFKIHWQQARFEQQTDGCVTALLINHPQGSRRIEMDQLILTAGEGNAELMSRLGIHRPAMQCRPLHQAIVKHHHAIPLYAHCIGTNPSPRLTISSHTCQDGENIWYLGGDLATQGVNQTPEQLINHAKNELASLFPWLDFNQAQWSNLVINRAEPRQKGLLKPDNAFAAYSDASANTIVAWPTKLSLAPALSDDILHLLKQGHQETSLPCNWQTLQHLDQPKISQPVWDTLFD